MWFLFAGIGVALSWVVTYGWGLAKGAELTRRAQARLHDALRGATESAIAAHARECAAREALELTALTALSTLAAERDASLGAPDAAQAQEPRSEDRRAAELASAQTHAALAQLSAALGEESARGQDAAPQGRRSVSSLAEAKKRAADEQARKHTRP